MIVSTDYGLCLGSVMATTFSPALFFFLFLLWVLDPNWFKPGPSIMFQSLLQSKQHTHTNSHSASGRSSTERGRWEFSDWAGWMADMDQQTHNKTLFSGRLLLHLQGRMYFLPARNCWMHSRSSQGCFFFDSTLLLLLLLTNPAARKKRRRRTQQIRSPSFIFMTIVGWLLVVGDRFFTTVS
jgi:hypothetical protein